MLVRLATFSLFLFSSYQRIVGCPVPFRVFFPSFPVLYDGVVCRRSRDLMLRRDQLYPLRLLRGLLLRLFFLLLFPAEVIFPPFFSPLALEPGVQKSIVGFFTEKAIR